MISPVKRGVWSAVLMVTRFFAHSPTLLTHSVSASRRRLPLTSSQLPRDLTSLRHQKPQHSHHLPPALCLVRYRSAMSIAYRML